MRSAHVQPEVDASTLRALNFAPEVVAFRQASRRFPSVVLGELISQMGESFDNIFTRIDCDPEFGVEMLDQADVLAAEPRGRWIRGDALPRLDDHRIRRGQILIAGTGTLGENEIYGRAIFADARLVGKYVGPNTLSLSLNEPEGDTALYAYAMLGTRTGIRLLRATSYGTKLLRLRQDLLKTIPIPLAEGPIIRRVAELVRASIASREEYIASIAAARNVFDTLPEVREAVATCRERRRTTVAWHGALPTLRTYPTTSSR